MCGDWDLWWWHKKGPVWKVDAIPQLDGTLEEEAVEEIVEQIRVCDFNPRNLKDSEEEINRILHHNNIQVIDRQMIMNFGSRKGFEFSIEKYNKKRILEIIDYLENKNPMITISIEF